MHPDIVARYPQSGETFNGRDTYLEMLRNFPSGLPEGEVTDLKGDASMVFLNPTLPTMAPRVVAFGGDDFTFEAVATYPDGSRFNVVGIIRLQGGLVIEETWYFAAPFDAPEWRRPYAEREGDSSLETSR